MTDVVEVSYYKKSSVGEFVAGGHEIGRPKDQFIQQAQSDSCHCPPGTLCSRLGVPFRLLPAWRRGRGKWFAGGPSAAGGLLGPLQCFDLTWFSPISLAGNRRGIRLCSLFRFFVVCAAVQYNRGGRWGVIVQPPHSRFKKIKY